MVFDVNHLGKGEEGVHLSFRPFVMWAFPSSDKAQPPPSELWVPHLG